MDNSPVLLESESRQVFSYILRDINNLFTFRKIILLFSDSELVRHFLVTDLHLPMSNL